MTIPLEKVQKDRKTGYWIQMQVMRHNLNFVTLFYNRSVKAEWVMTIILAVASSGSVASWVIWKDLAWMWALIVAVSQVGGIVKPLLPFSKRTKTLFILKYETEKICIDMERNWQRIFGDTMTESEIGDVMSGFDERYAEACHEQLAQDSLKSKKLKKIAGAETRQYFETRF